ncbi:uncharacterized protein VTP21DRAFT_8199 [Calcarisporiella thermophila]|uniref:uncharacterized protein n=1 Tax=Calcarisporiella thermophila TaxID=911321 RepID=UPI003742887D
MEEVKEFNPCPHTFRSDLPHGGAFGSSLSSGEPLWFYRYDSTNLEVRDINSCESRVFASLRAESMAKNNKEQLEIGHVVPVMIDGEHFLLVCANEAGSTECRTFLFNPFTQMNLPLDFPVKSALQVSCAAVSNMCIPTDADWRKAQTSGVVEPDRYHLLVLGTADAKLYVKKVIVPESSLQALHIEEVESFSLSKRGIGVITSIATLTRKAPSFENRGLPAVIAVGGSNGRVDLFEYRTPVDRRDRGVQSLLKLDALESSASITQLKIIPWGEEDKENGLGSILLIVGQGSPQHMTSKSVERPSLSIFKVDLFSLEYQLLGHTVASLGDGETFNIGHILTTSIVNSDIQRANLYAIFSIKGQHGFSKTEMVVWQVLEEDATEIARFPFNISNAHTILDLAPLRHSPELSVLFLNKMGVLVLPIELDSRRGDVEMTSGEDIPNFSDWFDLHPDKFSYPKAVAQQIESKRRRMDGQLFIDRLLQYAEIEIGQVYPPRDINQLQHLVRAVFKCDLDSLKKHCIVYYLLRDTRINARASTYASKYLIPWYFCRLMDGYWALDQGEFEEAVRALADPAVEPDWSNEIARILVRFAPPRVALRYLKLAQPTMTSREDVEMWMEVLIKCDILDAFLYQRKHRSKSDHSFSNRLLSHLFDACFAAKGTHIARLLAFPFDNAEEAFMKEYCLRSQHPLSSDFLLMWFVQHGHYTDAIRLHEQILLREKELGFNERELGSFGTDRKVIVENLKKILPEVQRTYLELENEMGIGKEMALSRNDGDVEMSEKASEQLETEGDFGAKTITTQESKASDTPSTRHARPLLPLSASKTIRFAVPQIDRKDFVYNPQKQLIRALLEHMDDAEREKGVATGREPCVLPTQLGTMMQEPILDEDLSKTRQTEEKLSFARYPAKGSSTSKPFAGPPRTPEYDRPRNRSPVKNSSPAISAKMAPLLPLGLDVMPSHKRRNPVDQTELKSQSPFSSRVQSPILDSTKSRRNIEATEAPMRLDSQLPLPSDFTAKPSLPEKSKKSVAKEKKVDTPIAKLRRTPRKSRKLLTEETTTTDEDDSKPVVQAAPSTTTTRRQTRSRSESIGGSSTTDKQTSQHAITPSRRTRTARSRLTIAGSEPALKELIELDSTPARNTRRRQKASQEMTLKEDDTDTDPGVTPRRRSSRRKT